MALDNELAGEVDFLAQMVHGVVWIIDIISTPGRPAPQPWGLVRGSVGGMPPKGA